MPFRQRQLDIATTQTRGIFDTYVYKNVEDTAAEMQAAGYFADSRFATSDPDNWFGGKIRCQASDGYFEAIINADGSGTITPLSFPATAAGNDTEVQFNSGGALGADTAFTFESGPDVLSVPVINNASIVTTGTAAATNFNITGDNSDATTLHKQSGGSNYDFNLPADGATVDDSLVVTNIAGTVSFVPAATQSIIPTFYTQDATLDSVTRNITFNNGGQLNLNFFDTNSGTFTQSANFFIDDFTAFMQTQNGVGLNEIRLTSNVMRVTDTINNRGLEYVADYSANFIDQSLVSKLYVDSRSNTIIFGANSVTGSTTTRYLFPGYADTAAPTNVLEMIAPRDGTLSNMYVRHNLPSGNGNDIVYTVRVDGLPTVLVVTIASNDAQGSNIVSTAGVLAGQSIDIEVTKALGIGASPIDINVTLEYL